MPVATAPADAPARLPVQYVIRHGEVRHCAAQLASGSLRVGDRVTIHPSGESSEITGSDVLGARPTGRSRRSRSACAWPTSGTSRAAT
ncbi:hypothetical protein GCM10010254_33800 [Streptomyces chromofuscus]|nr:hypothetical protein GCM10010254_33800 [Streptomyces chromofuscus]